MDEHIEAALMEAGHRIERLQARVAALEALLQPFLFDDITIFPDDNNEDTIPIDVSIGDIRRTRAAVGRKG